MTADGRDRARPLPAPGGARPGPGGIVRLDRGVPWPSSARATDAGADLHAAEDFELAPGHRRLVGTGVAVELPPGTAGFVHPRSGLAARLGLSIVNAPGTVDAGYRGEIKVCLINTDPHQTIIIRRGDRIAQLVVQPVLRADFTEVTELPSSERGLGGHGSTGTRSDAGQENT